MYSGIIYVAISKDGKKYFGRTISSLEKRKSNHLKFALNQNKPGYFYNALRKYGPEFFQWKIIEVFNRDSQKELNLVLNEREKFWISKEKSNLSENGYNMTDGGEGTSGFHLSGEAKKKLRDINLGREVSIETRNKISKNGVGMKGKSHTKEARKKMSKSKMGKDTWMKGKKHTEEAKQKMSESQSGEKNHNFGQAFSQEHRDKLSKSLKGKNTWTKGSKKSEETKRKISEAIKKKWQDNKK
jgi:group I intron endonuclease